jgi:hypothetical protein
MTLAFAACFPSFYIEFAPPPKAAHRWFKGL